MLHGNTYVDKELIASERPVSLGHFQLLYSTPVAILGTDTLRRQLPPLSDTVVAVAVDEAHCVFKCMQEQRLLCQSSCMCAKHITFPIPLIILSNLSQLEPHQQAFNLLLKSKHLKGSRTLLLLRTQ
ncbi:hypothetical protein EMCRGX_G010954 [Ephydatia muelleri]